MNVPHVHMIMNGRRQAAPRRFLKRGVIRRCLTLGLAAVLWVMVAVPASAAGAPDANNQAGTTSSMSAFGGSTMLAQTFTALTTGALDQVDLALGTSWNGAGTIYVVATDPATMVNGDPTTAKPLNMRGLSSGTYGPFLTCCSTFASYPIAPAFKVTANGHYAIVVVPNIGSSVSWAVNRSASYDYPAGQAWFGNQPSTWTYNTGFGYDFDFITYVTSAGTPPPPPSNSPPTVKANLDSVPVTEGVVPTASGTYSDSDGDTVTLTPSALTGSAGTVTPGPSGTWSWKGAAADEGQGQAITITADDLHGNKAQTQFSTVIGSTPPKAKISGAPASAREGTTIALTASATSDSAEDTAAGFKFQWSVNGSPVAGAGVNGASLSLKTDDESPYTITLTATDDGGFSGSTSVTINGTDSTPAAAISFSQPSLIVAQQQLTFNGSYTDAGSAVDTSYTAAWTWSDNYPSSSDLVATRSFPAPGTYTGTLTVKDDDKVGGSATVTVTVLTPADALAKITALVSGQSGLNAGQKNSLLAKLKAAGDAAQRGNTGTACNQLNAFVNEVDADQKTGRISSGDAGAMTDAARLTQRSMGCFRTLAEFLSGL